MDGRPGRVRREPSAVYHRRFAGVVAGGVKPCGHEDQLFAPDLSTPADARDFAGTDLPEFPDYKRRTVS